MSEKKDLGALERTAKGDSDAATGGRIGNASETTQAAILLTLADDAKLFHAPDRTTYADLTTGNHRETWPIRGDAFNQWLARRYFERCRAAPNKEAMQSALATLEARARFDAPERPVHLRVGECDGKLYLDLADENRRAVGIDATGWRIVADPPVRFRRAPGMKALPEPVRGGSIEALRRFLNVATDNDFVLAVAWLLATLRNRGPFPVLVLSGEQGSAKSTAASMLRAIVDPNTVALRALPRQDRDLYIAANSNRVVSAR
jgi:hypothetical protein